MQRIIEVIVSPKGETSIQTKGYSGGSCLAASQFLVLHRMEDGWPTTYPIVKFSIVIGGLIIVMLGLWDDTRLSSVEGTLASLAILLIPAALAFGISCVLDRSSKVERGSRKEQLPQ